LYVEPDGPRQFTGKVIVLTSPLTASAAEVFLMAMQTFPYVTIMGEPTSGGYSDILFRQLPMGWSFGLSNEVYRASDGEIYEKIGLPPNVVVPLSPDSFADGTDAILDAALELAAAP
jgi:C-terminal processing protease CtpA/Prc